MLILWQALEPAHAQQSRAEQQQRPEPADERGDLGALLAPAERGAEAGVDLLKLAGLFGVEVLPAGFGGYVLERRLVQLHLLPQHHWLRAALPDADRVDLDALALGACGGLIGWLPKLRLPIR